MLEAFSIVLLLAGLVFAVVAAIWPNKVIPKIGNKWLARLYLPAIIIGCTYLACFCIAKVDNFGLRLYEKNGILGYVVLVILGVTAYWYYKAYDAKIREEEIKIAQEALGVEIDAFLDKYQKNLIAMLNGVMGYEEQDRYNNFLWSYDYANANYTQGFRCIQLIKESLDIINKSSNIETMQSRYKLVEDQIAVWKKLGSRIVNQATITTINIKIQSLICTARSNAYVNVANRNIEKSEAAKMKKTKDKYQALAISALEAGLCDSLADKTKINALLDKIKSDLK